MVGGELVRVRPIGQVNALAAGQSTPDLFGHEWREWRRDATDGFEDGVQRVDRVTVVAVPEAIA